MNLNKLNINNLDMYLVHSIFTTLKSSEEYIYVKIISQESKTKYK